MLKRGLGVPVDDKETVRWYKKAAKQNYVISQNNLGYMYKAGKGVDQDITRAFYWFNKAADIGYASAQKNVGDMYRTGQGTGRDFFKAEDYYLRAANQDHSIAMNSLGVLHQQEGPGWIPNHDEAYKWYKKATESNVAASDYNLFLMYLDKNVPESDNLSDEECLAKGLTHLSKSVNHGNPSILGMLQYGQRLLTGRGIIRNKSEAIKWLMNVAMCGLPDAMESLERLRLGQLELLYFGVLELSESESTFPFVARASNAVQTLLSNQSSELIQEFNFINTKKNFEKKVLLLHALQSSIDLVQCATMISVIFDDLIKSINNEMLKFPFYSPCGPPLVECFTNRPYYEVSVAKVSFEILRSFVKRIKMDEGDIEIMDYRQSEYNQTLTLQIDDIGDNKNFVAFIVDDSEKPVFAHREIISQQYDHDRYFGALLGSMKESSQNIIHIHQVSRKTLELYLMYSYGLDIRPFVDGDSLMESIATAHLFCWSKFHNFLCKIVREILDWDQFSVIYKNAKSLCDEILVNECLLFVFDHFDELLDTRRRMTRTIHLEADILTTIQTYIFTEFSTALNIQFHSS